MKTVFITGASSGIGKATAEFFQQKGWQVVAAARNMEKTASRPNVFPLKMDITNPESVTAGIEKAIRRFGRIDVLVNNAGTYDTFPFETMDFCNIERIIDTNIKGTILMTQAILPHFRANGKGTIINVSSIAGRTAFPYQTVYHASKWAIEGFSESLFLELRQLGILVKLVEPGMVRTNLYDTILQYRPAEMPIPYAKTFGSWFRFLTNNYKKGYSPTLDAATIYKAAISTNYNRLRYQSDLTTKSTLLIRKILPAFLFRKLITKIVSS